MKAIFVGSLSPPTTASTRSVGSRSVWAPATEGATDREATATTRSRIVEIELRPYPRDKSIDLSGPSGLEPWHSAGEAEHALVILPEHRGEVKLLLVYENVTP